MWPTTIEYKSSNDFVVIDLFHYVLVVIILWVHKMVSSFTFCHFMFSLIAVIIFAMMCSIIHTFFLDFLMMESAFVWCIYLITALSTTDITECCGECWLAICYTCHAVMSNKSNTPYQNSWNIMVLQPYNHRVFSLSTHNMTEKNLWLLMWMFLRLQLPCFKQWVYLTAHKKIVLILLTFILQFGSYPLYTVCLPVQHLQLAHMPLHLHGRLHYKNSLSITEVL